MLTSSPYSTTPVVMGERVHRNLSLATVHPTPLRGVLGKAQPLPAELPNGRDANIDTVHAGVARAVDICFGTDTRVRLTTGEPFYAADHVSP